MKLFLLIVLLLAVPAAARTARAGVPADSTVRVMTFNIRFNNPGDGPNAWPHRKDLVASVVRLYEADLVGVQEALKGQLDDLQERLPGYAWVGVGRADGREGGEYSAIFYRTDRFEALDDGTFWLSPTPEVPGSRGWDAALERIATWVRLRDRTTGRTFIHFNTHFDHMGAQARAESAKLLRQRLAAADGAVVLTGDFNTTDASLPYRVLTGAEPGSPAPGLVLRDALRLSEAPPHGPTSTWNGFTAIEPGRRIDFIFVGDGVRVVQHAILADHWDGRFPSDHLPVLAEVVLP